MINATSYVPNVFLIQLFDMISFMLTMKDWFKAKNEWNSTTSSSRQLQIWICIKLKHVDLSEDICFTVRILVEKLAEYICTSWAIFLEKLETVKIWFLLVRTNVYNLTYSEFALCKETGKKPSLSCILPDPICGSNPKYLIGSIFLGKILFLEKDYNESTELPVQRKPKLWLCLKPRCDPCLQSPPFFEPLLAHGSWFGHEALPPWGDIQGKSEKTAQSIEQLQCREYFVLDLSLVSWYEMETIFFWLQCLLIGMENSIALCSAALLLFFFSFKCNSSFFLAPAFLVPSLCYRRHALKISPSKRGSMLSSVHLLYCYGEMGLLMMVSRKLGKTHPGIPLVPTLVYESHKGVRASCGRGEVSWVMTSSGVRTRGHAEWPGAQMAYFTSCLRSPCLHWKELTFQGEESPLQQHQSPLQLLQTTARGKAFSCIALSHFSKAKHLSTPCFHPHCCGPKSSWLWLGIASGQGGGWAAEGMRLWQMWLVESGFEKMGWAHHGGRMIKMDGRCHAAGNGKHLWGLPSASCLPACCCHQIQFCLHCWETLSWS